jgi:TetR/AcrR family transcriptional regulator, repressor for neighboring sulfatase
VSAVREATRRRRTAPEARRVILAAAEKRLAEGGPDAVRVSVVAADVGITDAAVHHHFGSREGLLGALLRHCGRKLRSEVATILAMDTIGVGGLRRAAEQIASVYGEGGAARLALWLALSGEKPRGSGMYAPLVDAVHAVRLRRARDCASPAPRRESAQHAVALLNVALVAEPIHGGAFLRSVEIADEPAARARFRRFLVDTLVRILEED